MLTDIMRREGRPRKRWQEAKLLTEVQVFPVHSPPAAALLPSSYPPPFLTYFSEQEVDNNWLGQKLYSVWCRLGNRIDILLTRVQVFHIQPSPGPCPSSNPLYPASPLPYLLSLFSASPAKQCLSNAGAFITKRNFISISNKSIPISKRFQFVWILYDIGQVYQMKWMLSL